LPSGVAVTLWLAGPADPCGALQHVWNILSSAEKDRANHFYHAQDRALFALTRAALRYLLSAETGILPQNIVFAEGPYGKLCLTGGGGPHFNVSHSRSFALIGLSASRPVGVDIEAMRALGGELDLAQAFFSDAEYRALKGLVGQTLRLSFYKIWTCKEAVLKACGCGITEHLKEFSVELIKDGFAIHPEPFCFFPAIASIAAGPVDVPAGYVGCYALA
jgi:4'-phosphopantetheinyl transferase